MTAAVPALALVPEPELLLEPELALVHALALARGCNGGASHYHLDIVGVGV